MKPYGIGWRASTLMSVWTPHLAPLLTMLASDRIAVSVNPCGKLATTRTRYGSATSPAWAL